MAEGSVERARIRFRQGTRLRVGADGTQTDFTVTQYAGEPYYDTDDGHVWIGDGTSQYKIDARALVAVDNEAVFIDNEAVLV